MLIAGLAVALSGAGGPAQAQWHRLPAAVDRLDDGRSDPSSELVVRRCAEQVHRAADGEGLDVVPLLAETWMAAVSRLPDGGARQTAFADRLARDLAAVALRSAMEGRWETAGKALARAVEISPTPDVLATARRLFLPPVAEESGQRWQSLVDGADFVWHPELQFRLGCTEGDIQCARNEIFFRWVTVPGLWVQATEVTREQYSRCVDAGGCLPSRVAAAADDDQLPVVLVSWEDARSYARWTGRRLPSEAEFERACRGDRLKVRFPWGTRFSHDRANMEGTSGGDGFVRVAPVGSFPPTGLGLSDIIGNVWEWCADTYHPNSVGAPKGAEAWVAGGLGRVVRSGSFRRAADVARVSVRTWQEEDHRAVDLGFRTVVSDLSTVSDAWLIRHLTTAFPAAPVTPDTVARAGVEEADALFLMRRTLTWYVIEGRPEEALHMALSVLDVEPSDQVARDVLDRIEDRVTGWTVVGKTRELERSIRLIHDHATTHPRFGARFRNLLTQVAGALEEGGRKLVARREFAEARRRFALAVLADPSRRSALDALESAEPEPGHRRVWPADQREMVWIPSGSFVMGGSKGDTSAGVAELPPHRRRIEGFWMDRREVTNDEYRRCVDAGACTPPDDRSFFDHPSFGRHPVVFVDWQQARTYAQWAGKRLPSEAEWEYAARAGSRMRYPWGDTWQDGRVNAVGALDQDRWGATAPVGEFPSNAWGVDDLLGNVAEWVADRWHRDYRGTPRDHRPWTDLTGGLQSPLRVIRGGSFESSASRLRVSRREDAAVDRTDRAVGFRCAADAE
jgi:formylglycine-generating enzyme required for sulfatase activity